MTPDRAEVLALVRSSPELVAAHDKAGWLGIFGREHVVEDPVGARPVRSDDAGALERFWDTFIAPNEIEFEVARDWVHGFDVVRDATVVSTLRPGVVVRTPAHLIYQTTNEDGALKVRRMAAYWEPRPVYRQMMRPTPAHVAAGLRQLAHMIRTLGVGSSLQFIGAARHVGRRRKRALLDELAGKGITGVTKLIASGDSVTANGVRHGAPVAVIARFARRSSTPREMQVYEDLA
ncbi:hypothetical protein [Aeromicrobium sp. NPDC092404]|uniref:hypothetical protein n=1 Tax=Aeromicrobium sp. NPDC092404 TaxID=3154976 RepID=UPI0034349AC7